MKKWFYFLAIFLLLFSVSSTSVKALPTITNAEFYTDNFGPNPYGWTQGHWVQFGAIVEETGTNPDDFDVQAIHPTFGSFALTYDGLYYWRGEIYDGSSTGYSSLGTMTIQATSNSEDYASGVTNPIDNPRLIPLTTNIHLSDSTLTWDSVYFDDNLDGSNETLVEGYRVRIYQDISGTGERFDRIWYSDFTNNPQVVLPDGLLQQGFDYYVRVLALDLDYSEQLGGWL